MTKKGNVCHCMCWAKKVLGLELAPYLPCGFKRITLFSLKTKYLNTFFDPAAFYTQPLKIGLRYSNYEL